MSNCMNLRPVGAKPFHADGRTDRHNEANSRFLQIFAYVPQTKAGLNEDD